MSVLSGKDGINSVVFRVDASTKIGTGHVMRCLTLADELRLQNISSFFICRELEGNLINYITSKNFIVHSLPKNPQDSSSNIDSEQLLHHDWLETSWEIDSEECLAAIKKINKKEDTVLGWLIVDHYALDHKWETQLKPHIKNILVIDDIADRNHNCDILLDQNLYDDMGSRYNHLIPITCRKLLGSKYALIRKEFISKRNQVTTDLYQIKNILIFFGGVDITNETKKSIDALQEINLTNISVNVIVGSANPNKKQIETLCQNHDKLNYYCQVNNMADYILEADLIIGAGGINAWERCILGKPSIVITTANNQLQQNITLDKHDACILLGNPKDVSAETIEKQLQTLINHPNELARHAKAALRIMDQHVGASGIIKTMYDCGSLNTLILRDILHEDKTLIFNWRNSDHVRKHMFNSDKIQASDHEVWFNNVLKRSDVDYKIVEINKRPIGLVNITNIDNNSCHWGFYLGEVDTPAGTGTKLAYDFINYIFSNYQINTIVGEILSANIKSIGLHQKLGFVQSENDDKDSIITMHLTKDKWKSIH